MKFSAEIDNTRTLKKGMKITLAVDNSVRQQVMKDLHNFMDRPLTIDIRIDDDEYAKRLNQITRAQQNKLNAILGDIAAHTGDDVPNLRQRTKESFARATELISIDDFSTSDCPKDIASAYIDYLIELALEMQVPMTDTPRNAYSDTDKYLAMCLRRKICCICGQPGENHHVDVIGMGRDRRTYDDRKHRKMCLCRIHHTEAGQIGQDVFDQKYHVYGIVWEG